MTIMQDSAVTAASALLDVFNGASDSGATQYWTDDMRRLCVEFAKATSKWVDTFQLPETTGVQIHAPSQ